MPNFPKSIVFGSFVATGLGGILILKDFMGGKEYLGSEKLTGKVVIVTGANTGIGKAVVEDLAKREAKIIMACRDLFKCETTRQQIVLDSKNKYIYCRKCDLSSQQSIRDFVKQFKEENQRLDILINNAGVMRCPKSVTSEGIEMQLGVNHMGHFLLTNLLIDTLKNSAPSRIINISSIAYKRSQINVMDLNSHNEYNPGAAYGQSKLANILFTMELAQRLKGTGVTVNAVSPGIVDTEITRHMPFYNSKLSSFVMKPFIWPFIRAPKRGAQSVLYAALDPNLKDVTGKLINNCKIVSISETDDYPSWQKWLWLTSEKWTSLKS